MITHFTKIVALVAALYFVIAVAMLGWVLYEVYTAGEALTDRVSAIADKNAKLKTYGELAKLIEDTQMQRSELETFVLTKNKTSSFLTDIESLGAAQGVLLSTNSLKVVEKEGSFNELVIQFSIEGKEAFVQKMLVLLETLPYHSHVSSLSYTREKTGTVQSTAELTMSLLKYEN